MCISLIVPVDNGPTSAVNSDKWNEIDQHPWPAISAGPPATRTDIKIIVKACCWKTIEWSVSVSNDFRVNAALTWVILRRKSTAARWGICLGKIHFFFDLKTRERVIDSCIGASWRRLQQCTRSKDIRNWARAGRLAPATKLCTMREKHTKNWSYWEAIWLLSPTIDG